MDYNVLDQEKPENLKLVPASKVKRFFNLILDQLAISFFYLLMVNSLGMFSAVDLTKLDQDPLSLDLMTNLTSILTTAILYCLMEGLLEGKTIGKYLTRTRTVNLDGSVPELETILKRSFLRIIPFEPVSFLGDHPGGWHDRWSDTMVIDEDLSDPAPSGYV